MLSIRWMGLRQCRERIFSSSFGAIENKGCRGSNCHKRLFLNGLGNSEDAVNSTDRILNLVCRGVF